MPPGKPNTLLHWKLSYNLTKRWISTTRPVLSARLRPALSDAHSASPMCQPILLAPTRWHIPRPAGPTLILPPLCHPNLEHSSAQQWEGDPDVYCWDLVSESGRQDCNSAAPDVLAAVTCWQINSSLGSPGKTVPLCGVCWFPRWQYSHYGWLQAPRWHCCTQSWSEMLGRLPKAGRSWVLYPQQKRHINK